jgi:hypothetical protein
MSKTSEPVKGDDTPKKKSGLLFRSFDFIFSLKSWKRSLTSPLKPLKRFGPIIKRDAAHTFNQFDTLEVSVNRKELLLAVKKTTASMLTYALFSLFFAGLGGFYIHSLLSDPNFSSLMQCITFSIITLVFIFRAYADFTINRSAKNDLKKLDNP